METRFLSTARKTKFKLFVMAILLGVIVKCVPVFAVTATLDPVSGIKQTKITTNSATITWNKVKGATHYIFFKKDSVTPIDATTSNSYTFKNLASGEVLSGAYIMACTSNGENITDISKEKSAYITVKTLPKTIENFEAMEWKTSKKMTVSWKGVASADSMQIQVFDMSTGKQVGKTYTFVPKSDSLKVNGISSGNSYKLRIRSLTKINGKKNYSAWTTTYTAIIKNAGFARVGKEKKIKVSWDKVKKVSSYTVYASASYSGEYKKVGETSGTSLTFAKIGSKALKKGQRYYVRICPNVKVKGKTYKGLLGYWSSSVYCYLK